MSSNIKLSEISKMISYILRHNPDNFGLVLDEYGFVSVDALINALRSIGTDWQLISSDDIDATIASSEKKRHEIMDNKIRALYGHSCMVITSFTSVPPPKILFHGTSPQNLVPILRDGLLPMKRQYVHLSANRDIALSVGKRKDSNPVILRIDSENAFACGVLFYQGNKNIWLANSISPQFITIECPCPAPLTNDSNPETSVEN